MIPVLPGAVLAAAVVLAPTHGIATPASASLGYRYIASPLPMGTHVRVCGPDGCISGQVTGYWPSWRYGIVSLYEPWFRVACGSSPCWVSVQPPGRYGGPQ